MIQLIADSGSTKTAWCITDHESVNVQIVSGGINPFQQSEEDICALLHHELLPALDEKLCKCGLTAIEEVCYYGAGCTPEKSVVVKSALRSVLGAECRIFVGSDMLGAARAACGHEAGICCILGTGANSCRYDGRDVTDNVSPLGYILGDEGSGAYIGKRLVGNCLKRQFSDEICRMFLDETKLTTAEIINKVYRQPLANKFLASLSPFCARHRDIDEIHDFLIDCFSQFFVRNVANYPDAHSLPVHFVGSIAWYYRAEVAEAAARCGYTVGKIVQAPLDGIVEYHK